MKRFVLFEISPHLDGLYWNQYCPLSIDNPQKHFRIQQGLFLRLY